MSFVSRRNPCGPLLAASLHWGYMWGFASRCFNDIFTWILSSLSCAHSVSHFLSLPAFHLSFRAQKFLANGALCRTLAQFKILFAPAQPSFSLLFDGRIPSFWAYSARSLSHANLEALDVCQVALTLLLILISSAFWNLREIKVVCGRTYVRAARREMLTPRAFWDKCEAKKCLDLVRWREEHRIYGKFSTLPV